VNRDEPELGLHPVAIALIGDMIKSLATQRQIIVATQSPLLVDTFELDEILVLDLIDPAAHCPGPFSGPQAVAQSARSRTAVFMLRYRFLIPYLSHLP